MLLKHDAQMYEELAFELPRDSDANMEMAKGGDDVGENTRPQPPEPGGDMNFFFCRDLAEGPDTVRLRAILNEISNMTGPYSRRIYFMLLGDMKTPDARVSCVVARSRPSKRNKYVWCMAFSQSTFKFLHKPFLNHVMNPWKQAQPHLYLKINSAIQESSTLD